MLETQSVQVGPVNHDYKNALIIGLTTGIFLEPLILNLGIGTKYPWAYAASIILVPLLAIVGLKVAQLIFSKIPVLWQFSKFGLVGVGNTVINFGVLNLLVYISGITVGTWLYLFSALAFLAALVHSYIWNSHWSFKNTNPRTTEEFIVFALVTFVGLLININIVGWLAGHSLLSPASQKIWVNLANLIATLCTMIWNFAGFKFFVFKEKTPQPQQPI